MCLLLYSLNDNILIKKISFLTINYYCISTIDLIASRYQIANFANIKTLSSNILGQKRFYLSFQILFSNKTYLHGENKNIMIIMNV